MLLGLIMRFRGELERANLGAENFESSEVPRRVLDRDESLPLAKLGRLTRRSRPDITAAMAFFPGKARLAGFSGLCWLLRRAPP